MQGSEKDNDVSTGESCPEMLDFILRRRSCPLKNLSGPGPDEAQIRQILSAASRVPDHGRMVPWHFIVIAGEARRRMGALVVEALLAEQPDAPAAKRELEAARFLHAPVVIGVVSRLRRGKKPLWEQILSAGTACYNLCLAANAMGFGTNWVTEWYSFSAVFREKLGLEPQENIAGFIHIGTPMEKPEERPRPDLSEITTYWTTGSALKRGTAYEPQDQDYPDAGFDLSWLKESLPEGR